MEKDFRLVYSNDLILLSLAANPIAIVNPNGKVDLHLANITSEIAENLKCFLYENNISFEDFSFIPS